MLLTETGKPTDVKTTGVIPFIGVYLETKRNITQRFHFKQWFIDYYANILMIYKFSHTEKTVGYV